MDPLAEKYPNIGSYVYCLNNPVKYVDPDGRNPIDPRTGQEISMNLYCAAVYDDYSNETIPSIRDNSLYKLAKPYNYQLRRQFNKPDGLWEGAWYLKRGNNLSKLSAHSYNSLKLIFPNKSDVGMAYQTPNDFLWLDVANQGSYIYVDNIWSESLWLHSRTNSFNIITVTKNRITQIVNLSRLSGDEQYNLNSVTTFDISVGEIQSRIKNTWWGGVKTESFRILNVTESTIYYKNNKPNGNTTRSYQTEEIVR